MSMAKPFSNEPQCLYGKIVSEAWGGGLMTLEKALEIFKRLTDLDITTVDLVSLGRLKKMVFASGSVTPLHSFL